MAPPIRILHLHSTFDLGGKEARAVRLMNAFGDRARHSIVSSIPGALGAQAAIAPDIEVDFPNDVPLAGRPAPGRFRRLARCLARFDLVLSYNWGAIDGVMARRLFGGPPLIHHEDGFNEDENGRQNPARVAWRRIALPAVHRLIVPSHVLENIAGSIWRQPPERIRHIANGIAVDRFAEEPERDAIPGFRRDPDEVVVGTLAGLRAVKNLPRLVRAFAAAARATERPMRLVIIGEGAERARILETAAAEGVADRLLMPGFLADPARYIGHFDIFALSSDSEQAPISLVEAMAAGLPVVATAVGDVSSMVSAVNSAFIVRANDEAGFAQAITRVAASDAVRARLGAANRRHASEHFREEGMIAAYCSTYDGALGGRSGLEYRP
jgi:glycosyltransferase involved in cell wall biosynthesis